MGYINLYPKSFYLYMVIGAIVVLLALLASKSGKKLPMSLVFLTLTLTLFSGLRGMTVGIDTVNYIKQTINPILNGRFSAAYGEIGFKSLVNLFLNIHPTYTAVFLGLSLLISILFVWRFWELRKQINFVISIFGFYCIVYLSIFNTIRQLLSMAIVFWGTRYLFKKNYIIYVATVLLSATIHTAGLIGVALIILFEFLSGETLTVKKTMFRIFLSIAVLYVLFYVLNMDRVQFYVDKYAKSGVSLGGMMAYFEIAMLVIIETIDRIVNKRRYEIIQEKNSINNVATISYLTGLIIRIFGYKYLYLGRMGDYFCIFQFVYYGNLNCSLLKKQMKVLAIVVLSLYTIISVIGANGYGIMPYSIYN